MMIQTKLMGYGKVFGYQANASNKIKIKGRVGQKEGYLIRKY